MQPTPPTPQQPTDVRPTGDTEEIYYQGTPRLRGELGMVALWWIPGLLLLAGSIWWLITPWENSPRWYALIGLAVGLLCIWIPIIVNKFVRYRVSNYRIDVERGLLSRTIDTLELWHVEDIKFHQSLMDRILGVGTITIYSNDATNPQLPLRSLPNPRATFESIKQRVIAVKRQRGVLKLDGDAHFGQAMT
jgi:membrane protein YdbS with pleckstrin-like domain